MPQDLNLALSSSTPLAMLPLMMNLAVGVVLALILRFHFRHFGSTLTNREEFSQVFPFILLTTVLIITVVKSSLALSLGLVGALSIVRFRTPIKEPEELAYLFMAIAMGLGLGANQTLTTAVASVAILAVMAGLGRFRGDPGAKSIYLSIDLDLESGANGENQLEKLVDLTAQHSRSSDLRRFDIRGDRMEATFLLDIQSSDDLAALTNDLKSSIPAAGITFLDQNQLPTV
jgi:hypothetical protein